MYKPVNKARVALITAALGLLSFGGLMGVREYNKSPEQKAAERELSMTKKQLGLERDQVGEAAVAYMSEEVMKAVNSSQFNEATTIPPLVEQLKAKFNTTNIKIESGESSGCICGSVSGAKVVVVDRLGTAESYSR